MPGIEKKTIIFVIAVFIIVSAGYFLLKGVLESSKKNTEKELYEKLQSVYEERITELKERIVTEVNYRHEIKEYFFQALKKDSLLNLQFQKNQLNYSPLKTKMNEIPAIIQRISNNDDSIRAAFAED